MRILFASDFHLGSARKAGFTAESSVRREDYSFEMLGKILETPHDLAVCGGDFFDRFTNSETCISEAAQIAKKFTFILPGNHDVSGRQGVIGSLELMHLLNPEWEPFERGWSQFWESGTRVELYAVPHQLTQALFLDQLDHAKRAARRGEVHGWKILLLHCNYDSPFDLSESSLNLTQEKARELLQVFHFVLLGHEHRALDDYDGRLRIIGSHLPTDLGDLTDKRHLVFDTDTGHFESITHWSAAAHAYTGPAAGAPTGRQFYVLSECADHKLPVQLFKEGAFAVRLLSEASDEARPAAERPRLHQLPALIEQELAEQPDQLALWKEFTK